MKLTYEALLADPRIMDRILADARRARAETVHELLVAPVTRLLNDHAPRPHLARQG